MYASIGSSLGDPLFGVLAVLSIVIAGALVWDAVKEKREDRRQKRARERRRQEYLKQGIH